MSKQSIIACYGTLVVVAAAGVAEFRKTRDLWMAVNASSHYRKCDCARDAESLLDTIKIGQQKPPKLESALCTTRGGVMRDLRRWDEALQLGQKAHALAPKDYRPCTLLGALHMEMGNYQLSARSGTPRQSNGAPQLTPLITIYGIFSYGPT